MQVISLFSGIGGFEDAAQQVGWDNVVSCEINKFGKYVLEGHWPNAYHHDDIHTLNYETIKEKSNWNPEKPTIIVGGFPCQPYSTAGKRLGKEDERHLWPSMLRLISEVKPDFVVGENVRGLLSWSDGLVFEEVCADLEAQGYEVWPYILPAAGVGAPHRRDRIWFVATNTRLLGQTFGRVESVGVNQLCEKRNASNTTSIENKRRGQRGFFSEPSRANDERITTNPESKRGARYPERKKEAYPINASNGEYGFIANPNGKRLRRKGDGARKSKILGENVSIRNWDNFPTQSPLRNGNDGFPTESLRQRIREDSMGHLSEKEIDQIISSATTQWANETIKAGGNAIVHQVAVNIFKSIQLLINENT